jgi:hypothetical protein
MHLHLDLILRFPSSPSRSQNIDLLNIVLELPPAPAALVELGRWFAVFSARSAAAFLRITVAGPPGGFGDAGRAVVEPWALLEGEVARGEDCDLLVSLMLLVCC